MPLPYWLPATLKGGETIGKLATGLFSRKKPFRDTAYGKYLNKIRTEGAISPLEKSKVLGGVARTSGGVGGRRRESYLGRLKSMGVSGSIAGEEKAADIGSEYQQQLGETSQDVDIANIKAKRVAREAYARGADEAEEEKRQWGQNLVQNFLSGVTETGKSLYQGQLMEQSKTAVTDLLTKAQNGEITPEQLDMELLKLGLDPEEIQALAEM